MIVERGASGLAVTSELIAALLTVPLIDRIEDGRAGFVRCSTDLLRHLVPPHQTQLASGLCRSLKCSDIVVVLEFPTFIHGNNLTLRNEYVLTRAAQHEG